MEVSIVHFGVRARPERAVRVAARADGRAINVTLDGDVIQHICGDASEGEQMLLSLTHNQEALRIAIAAYVSARGVPIDEQFLLSWRDFSEANRSLVMRSGTDR